MQLIREFHEIFRAAELSLKLQPYAIVATSTSSGLVETVSEARSIDAFKRSCAQGSLLECFRATWGSRAGGRRRELKAARRRFVESMAAYSVVSYILQVKDRHNGNILIADDGRVVHIDFGFFLQVKNTSIPT